MCRNAYSETIDLSLSGCINGVDLMSMLFVFTHSEFRLRGVSTALRHDAAVASLGVPDVSTGNGRHRLLAASQYVM